MSFKQWLNESGKKIDMTGDAWQIHDQVDAYVDDIMSKLDSSGFIKQDMKDTYGYDRVMLEHLYHVNESSCTTKK